MFQTWVNDAFGVFHTVKTEVSHLMHKDSCCQPEKTTSKNIMEAAANGSQSEFREFVLQGGLGVITAADPDGNTPAHFAALHNQLDILKGIYDAVNESDGLLDLAAALNSSNKTMQTPLHWASVGGNIKVVDFLLKSGVTHIDQQDGKGCTPLITAAQYGKANLCAYLLAKGASGSLCDNENDNALHWASSKGKADLIRLLVYHGFTPDARDNFGQTPLHFACLSGDLNCVRDLCTVDNVEINIKDHNGKTPLMLAAGRRYEVLVAYLKSEIQRRRSISSRPKWRTYILGDPGLSRNAMLYLILTIVLWGYPFYFLRMLPLTYSLFPNLHIIFMMANILLWIFYCRCVTSDPGFIPRNMVEYDLIVRQAGEYGSWDSPLKSDNPLDTLCHTCRIVKPPRTKHCRMCNRCILECDHHCPYILNCVGLFNRHWFAYFMLDISFLAVVGCYVLWHTWLIIGIDFLNVFCVAIMGIGVIVVLATNSCVWYHAMRNLTTNEAINWKRYSYLKDMRGHFQNKYNRGCFLNLAEFLHFIPSQVTRKEYAWKEGMTGWSSGKSRSSAVMDF